MWGRAVCIALVVAACSSEEPPPPNTCWRGEDRVREEGRVELGIGFGSFEPLDDEQEVPLEAGAQGLHHFVVNARMWDLEPGDISKSPEEQPQTRFSAFFEDGRVVDDLDCSFPLFYVPRSDGGDGYDLYSGRLLVVDEELVADVPGQRIRIVVEVVDVEQRYAIDERWINAVAGPEPGMSDAGPDAGMSDAGLDAGMSDAGPDLDGPL
jgi:hypothetical protein